MLADDFPDEIIIRYLAERRRTRQEEAEKAGERDISKGYAYINDEKLSFSSFRLPGGWAFVLVPDEFLEDSPPEVTENSAEIYSYDKSIRLTFEISTGIDVGLNAQTGPVYTESAEETINEDGETGESFCLIFTLPLLPEKETDGGRVTVSGRFTCAEYRTGDWKEILFQIMRSISR